MTTLDHMVQEVRSRALSGFRDEKVPGGLAAAMDTATQTVSFQAGTTKTSVEMGTLLQIDYELMEVIVVPTADAATVTRGVFNSLPAPHAAGAQIVVNPHFPIVDIVSAINEDIDDLSSPGNGLYQALVTTFTFNPAIVGYDLPGLTNDQVAEIIEVRTWDYGAQQQWPLIPPSQYKLERNASPIVFPSGMSLKLYHGAYPGRPVRVQYKSRYTTPLVNPGDDVQTTTGLQPTAHDIPPLGAGYRLLQWREFKRSFTEAQGEPRRAAEVPVGSSLTALKGVQQMRADRINTERERLNKIYKRQRR
jgi:hypothetical protein